MKRKAILGIIVALALVGKMQSPAFALTSSSNSVTVVNGYFRDTQTNSIETQTVNILGTSLGQVNLYYCMGAVVYDNITSIVIPPSSGNYTDYVAATSYSGSTTKVSHILIANPGDKIVIKKSMYNGYITIKDGSNNYIADLESLEVVASMEFTMPASNQPEAFSIDCSNEGISHLIDSYSLIPTQSSGNPTDGQAAIVEQAISLFDVSNSTSINDLQNVANSVIDTSKYSVSVSQTAYQSANESTDGYISGNILVTDNNSGKQTTNSFNKVIPKLSQSLSTIGTSLTNYCNNYNATNSSSPSDFSNAITITNPSYNVNVGNWSKTNATASTAGSLSCNVYIQQNGTTVYTIPVSKIIPKLADNVAMAKAAISSALSNYKASNTTSATNLLNLAKSVVNTNYITVTGGAFSITNATESTNGSLSYTVNLHDTYGSNDSYTANLSIDKLATTASTAYTQVQNLLNNYNATNSTTSVSLLSLLNSTVSTEQINLTLSNFVINNATETNKGSITATLTIKDLSNTTLSLPISLSINALVQSVSTLADEYTNYINDMQAKNSTIASDILNAITVTNQNIAVTMQSYNVTPATDKIVGSIVGSIKITDGTNTQYVPINKQISKLLETAQSAEDQINSVLSSYTANNSTDSNTLLSDLNKVIDPDYITLSVPSFSKSNATETNTGTITGTVKIADTYGSTLNLPLNLTIGNLNQSLDTVFNLYTSYIATMNPLNTTTVQSILSSVKITNQNITATLNDLVVTPATDTTEGSITGNIVLSEPGYPNQTVNINRIISRVNQTVSTAKSNILAALNSFSVSNNTTQTDYENLINNSIDTTKVSYTITNFKITQATESTRGSITGLINLKDTYGNTASVNILNVIDYLNQSIDTVANLYGGKLPNYVALNTTTSNDILGIVNISNADITAQMLSYIVDPATDTQKGKITGIILLTNTKTGETKTVPVYLIIDYLPQELATTVKLTQDYLGTVTPSNTLDFTAIINHINNLITNSNINAAWDYGTSSTPETLATETNSGLINKNIVITDSTSGLSVKVPVVYTVPKLPYTASGVQSLVQNLLSSYTATNYSNSDNLLNYFLSSINGLASSNVSLSVENFSIVPATETTQGYIDGKIDITDGTSTVTVPLNKKPIALIPQTIDGIEELISNACNTLQVSNGTTNTSLLNSLNTLITGASGSKISLAIDGSNFSLIPSTIDSTGLITAKVEVIDNSTNRDLLPITITVPKLPQTVGDAMAKLNNLLSTYHATNDTTANSLVSLFDTTITGTPGNTITISVNPFNITNSTDSTNGSITGTIIVSDNNGNSTEEPLNLTIQRTEYQEISDVITRADSVIDTLKADPSKITSVSYVDSLFNNIRSTYPSATIDTSGLTVTNPTQDNTGLLQGQIIVALGNSTSEISTSIIIPQSDKNKDDKVVSDLNNLLSSITVGSITSLNDLNNYLNSIKAEYPYATIDTSQLIVTQPTADSMGSITGNIVVTVGNTSINVPVNITIPQTDQNILDKNLEELNSYLNSIDPSTISSLDYLNNSIATFESTHSTITLDTSKIIYNAPTGDSNGSISGTILVTYKGLSEGQQVSMVLPKNIQAKMDSIASEINSYILNGNIKSEDDYISYLASLKTKYPDASFDTSGITLIDSTTSKGGSAKGTLVISENGHSSSTTISLNFTKATAIAGGGGGGGGAAATTSPVTTSVDTSNPVQIDSTSLSQILGLTGDVKVLKYQWTAYKDSSLVNSGDLQAVYNNGNIVGVLVDANSPLDPQTQIDISFLKGSNLSNVYIYNSDISSYVLSGNTTTDTSGNVSFSGNNKSTYIVTSGAVTNNSNFVTNGWVNKNSNWYLVNNAECQTGWVSNNNNWYYIDPTSKTMQTGWVNVNNAWYYLNNSSNNLGSMQTGWVSNNNNWYYMNSSGSLATGWIYNNSNWYYLNSSGEMQTGWVKSNSSWYYLDSNGQMLHDATVDGYNLGSDGALAQ